MHTINGHLIVELPDGYRKLKVVTNIVNFQRPNRNWDWIILPAGSYTILCTLQEALDSEELAGKIVDAVAYEDDIHSFGITGYLKIQVDILRITNPSNWIVLKRA